MAKPKPASGPEKPAWLKAMEAEEQKRTIRPKHCPTEIIANTMDLANLAVGVRRIFKVRQADLARRAGVSRQWLVGFEQGKQTCEIALVLRTLEAMGLDMALQPREPLPDWLVRAKLDAQYRAVERQRRKRKRRISRRELDRTMRISNNRPRVEVDLD